MRKTLAIMGSTAVAAMLLLTGSVAFAQTAPQGPQGAWGARMGMHRGMGVLGTVSGISGATLTLQSKGFGKNASTTTTYTVNAGSATVTKTGASSSLSAIAIGDTVVVQGTVNGTTITAKMIRDGVPQGKLQGKPQGAPRTPMIQGNGQPVVGGNVTAVSGSTLTVTTQTNVVYTVDASSATVIKGNATSSLANIAVGDSVIVQGTVNGTSVTASSVIDHGTAATNVAGPARGGGFFGAIGGFFRHMFGF